MTTKKSYAPPPPDYSGLVAAQMQAQQLAAENQKDQLAWAKEQFAKTTATSDKIVDASLARQKELDQQALEDRQRYQTVFQPMEDSLVKEAQDYSTPARQEARAGAAMADVSQQFEQARSAAQDRLESFGLDPSQVRGGALDLGTRVQEAAARAGAGNLAREQVAQTGRALRSEAINLGRSYPGQTAQSYQIANQSGGLGGSTTFGNVQSGAGTMGTPMQWGTLGNQSLAGAVDAQKTGYGQLLDAYKFNKSVNDTPSGWGTALGLIGGIGMAGATAPASSALGQFALGLAEGGTVPEDLSPSGGRAIDDIPARGPTGAIQLDGGEFVVPDDVVRWKGEEFFQKTIENARKKKAEAPAKPEVRQALDIAAQPEVRAALGVTPGGEGAPGQGPIYHNPALRGEGDTPADRGFRALNLHENRVRFSEPPPTYAAQPYFR